MSSKVITISILLFIFSLLFAGDVQAGCESRALCDAPPGACARTCNDGQVCTISNGRVVTTIQVCTCSKDGTPCTIKGGLCAGSGPDPYNADTGDYGICGDYPGFCTDVAGTQEQCFETVWDWCCTATQQPSPTPLAQWCGDGICQATIGEDCSTCETDCGVCLSSPICGDSVCNGGENCTSCSADCGNCPVVGTLVQCGNSICESGESCADCPQDCGSCLNCGDGTCSAGESCSTCAADCGSCPTSCGDGLCTGFENCESCAADCGLCILQANQPWWQAANGMVYAGDSTGISIQSNIFDGTCIQPDCIASLIMPDLTGTIQSEGVAITGGGRIETNGFTNAEQVEVRGSSATRLRETYAYFYRNSGLGLHPEDDFVGQEQDIRKPATHKEAYFQRGDVTLQSAWHLAADESYLIFIDGNLKIADPDKIQQLITVQEGGFLAFIVSGDIEIDASVGNIDLHNSQPNLEGIFLADGNLFIRSRGVGAGGDDRFIGAGSFISWTTLVLERDYSDGAGRELENQNKPTETFLFRPDFIVNTPDNLKRPLNIWQERN